MKQSLSLRISQHLALTPQLQQSIRLLQLSTLELNQEVEQLLDENPFLERADDSADREAFGLDQADAPPMNDDHGDTAGGTSMEVTSDHAQDAGHEAPELSGEEAPAGDLTRDGDWEGDGSVELAPDDSEWGGDAPPRNGKQDDDDAADATELARAHETLQDHLRQQALALRLAPPDRAALLFLIESLNDDGYLEDSLEALATSLAGEDLTQLGELLEHFQLALRLLHQMDPSGVGARSLSECLRLQLQQRMLELPPAPVPTTGTQDSCGTLRQTLAQALRLIEQPPELLARRDLRRLTQLTGGAGAAGEALTREALAVIARLEPKPGRRFVDVERHIITPDVLVQRVGGNASNARFRVMLNPDVMPRLRVHDIYANALKGQRGSGGGTRDSSSHAALQQRLQEARWFIKNIQQRFDTILRVANAIVDRQKSFFVHGELAMRPLVLREIADELGLHESTISRVTTAKYMATPYGTYELKYFFGSGLGTESGSSASSTAVRALIKQFVGAENPKKPLSDSQLSDMLKEQGIECARRTVAKYRETLKIAPANLRKTL
ncbi:RNA polymerase subunit sigma-54 [Hylemonella gracilis str. Niagara R]|uniref:RNA polymerase sigma-54 factor n=1 Tax=Hylemonella gracilis str. Niagara R TaxID=1458275 RepID=A0A016XDH3_9BURK|nr:RNA polymerase factor sigma-54 [Hylemonella gracilis]EYC50139.1 RNA polymerase subunit sigma-54 [Hylemonella gracilis str. Niagara R]